MPASCLQVAHSLNVNLYCIVKHLFACPFYVSHGGARVTVVQVLQPALLESSGIVTQRKQALVVLMQCLMLVSCGADCRTPSPNPRRIDPSVGLRAALGKTTAHRTRTPAGRRGALLEPLEWPILPLVLLHPVPGAMDYGGCLLFLDDLTCCALWALRPLQLGFRLLGLHGQAAHCPRRRHCREGAGGRRGG